jgi:hypothetical protein
MKYMFKIVDIIVFDVHTAVRPLLDPALVQPQFQFLVDPAKYVKQHQQQAPFVLGDFSVESLATKRQALNYFWQRCASISHGAAPDLWKLQIPFICETGKVTVEFSAGLANTKVLVFPSIYLSALGWSTSLHLRIFGALSPIDLIGVVGRLRNDPAFTVAGVAKRTLSDTFIALSNVVKRNLYLGTNPLYDRVTTPRHSVISVARYDGAPAAFDPSVMQASDRAEIHSILHGRSITLAQLTENELSNSFLQTQYAAYDFALTYFELGSLLWMQSPRQKGKRNSLWCLPSNLAALSMYLLGLNGFWKTTELQATANQTIKDLREAIRFTVNQLADAYSNKLCRAFLRQHKGLSKIT